MYNIKYVYVKEKYHNNKEFKNRLKGWRCRETRKTLLSTAFSLLPQYSVQHEDCLRTAWKKLTASYETRNYIIMLTIDRLVSYFESHKSIPPQLYPLSNRSVLILSYQTCLRLLSCLFASGFCSKILCSFFTSPYRSTCSA